MTSNDEKTMHQQCSTPVEDAISYADDVRVLLERAVAVGEDGEAGDHYLLALAAEVRRLREHSHLGDWGGEERAWLRNALADAIEAGAEMEIKLARVEALPAQWRERSAEEYDDVARSVEMELATELESALRGTVCERPKPRR